jgi:hypothetical protein
LTGSPPKALYVETLNSRLFLVSATEPNRLWFSALGDHADFTSTGLKIGSGSILVGANEGDSITGIKAHLGRLFIFKRTRVYVLTPGSPNTDKEQWVVELLTDRVGGHGYTAQSVLTDLVFLSDHGVMSLQAVQQVGDFQHAVLSTKVLGLREFDKSVVNLASVINSDRLQYWLAVPVHAGDTVNTVTYVMDYTGLASGAPVAWTAFTGKVVGTAYAQVVESGRPRVYVGTGSAVYRYGDDGVFSDDGTFYEKVLVTKAFSPGPALWRKEFHRYGFEFECETDDGNLSVLYRLDESDDRSKNISIPFGKAQRGSRWDEGLWDTATFVTTGSKVKDFTSRFAGTVGRRGQTVQFRLYNNAADGFSVKRLTVDAVLLTRNHASDIEVT